MAALTPAPPPTSELWVTVIAGFLMAINACLKKYVPIQIDDHTLTAIAGLIVAYIIGRSAVKAAFAMSLRS